MLFHYTVAKINYLCNKYMLVRAQWHGKYNWLIIISVGSSYVETQNLFRPYISKNWFINIPNILIDY